MDGLSIKECLHDMVVEKYSLEEATLINGGGIDEERPSKIGRKRVAAYPYGLKNDNLYYESKNDQFDPKRSGLKPVRGNGGLARRMCKWQQDWEEITSRGSMWPKQKNGSSIDDSFGMELLMYILNDDHVQ